MTVPVRIVKMSYRCPNDACKPVGAKDGDDAAAVMKCRICAMRKQCGGPSLASRKTDAEVISELSALHSCGSAKAVVRKFAPAIIEARDRGVSWKKIAEKLTECGYPVSDVSLNSCVVRFLKTKGEKK